MFLHIVFAPSGNFFASKIHLDDLVNNVNKSLHLLGKEDIRCEDRMNFKSVIKIASEKVINCLKQYIKRSEGTVAYLSLMKSVMDPFLSEKIDPLERIECIWYSTFFFTALASMASRYQKS